MPSEPQSHIVGILLAAGKGVRFDPDGNTNKLLHVLPRGESVGLASAHHLLEVLPFVVAAVRPGADELARQLRQAGCTVVECADAEQGMGVTLAFALAQALGRDADGWLIALADMPYVEPETLRSLVMALERGADIAAPVYQGRRGNPVGFSRRHLTQLLGLDGDQGARNLLMRHPVTEVPVDDAGVIRDIDELSDLD